MVVLELELELEKLYRFHAIERGKVQHIATGQREPQVGTHLDRDEEVFGPFAQITVVKDLEQAIEQANLTRFGLAASIFTADDDAYETFFARANAGCINRNTGTAGASSKLPFGGLGHSGNHRPAAAFSVDYCVYPVANMVEKDDGVAIPTGMQWDDGWIG